MRVSPPVQKKESYTGVMHFENNAVSNPLQPKQGSADAIYNRQNPLQLFKSNNSNPLQLQSKQENKTGLPDTLKENTEALSGYSMDDVSVYYNSDKPAQLNALSYAQGTDIHIAPGQEQHLPHEVWHVVQQKQGRVEATMQMRGVYINDNNNLEKEAGRIGTQALPFNAAGSRSTTVNSESSVAGRGEVIQRAIAIGTNPLPRTVDTPAHIVDFLQKNGLDNVFVQLNDERETIYIFESDDHLINYLKHLAGQPVIVNNPLISKVSPSQLNQGHQFAADARFASLYQPGASQISENARGAHKIPGEMLPPPGQAHQWGQVPDPSAFGQEYVLYQHAYQPSSNTVPLTFGDPDAPSMVMNQGGLNLGMHIQPTSDTSYLNQISRSQTNYAGLPSVTGRVRGHPFELKQNQISTDDDDMDFDQSSQTYTDESDATKEKGGISTWRYNEVEKKAEQSGLPFTQVNNNPVMGAMGIARPDSMYYRIQQPSGGYKDLLMDNTGTTDYRDTDAIRPHDMGKQAYQTEMGYQEALLHPYQPPSVRKPGEDFTDPNRHTYPGYVSPPPTPFMSEDTIAAPAQEMILRGYPHVGSRVNMPDGTTGIVVRVIDRDEGRVKTRCKVKSVPVVQWPGSFNTT